RLSLFLLLTAAAVPMHADTLTYTIAPISGKFVYQFTLTNTGGSGSTLFDLFLSLPTSIGNIETSIIGKPPGWGDGGGQLFFGPDVSPSTSFIEWAADFSGSFDVAIGNSLSGFSFTSATIVGPPIRFALNGSTNFMAAQQLVVDVPEPSLSLTPL